MTAGIPDLSPPDFISFVHSYGMAKWINTYHEAYSKDAERITGKFNFDKSKGWVEFSTAIDILAKSLSITSEFDETFANFKKATTIAIGDAARFKAAYYHLLASRILKARLCE